MSRYRMVLLLVAFSWDVTPVQTKPPQSKKVAMKRSALPNGAVAQLGSSRFRFGQFASTVRFTHDGKHILLSEPAARFSFKSPFGFFNARSGQELRRWSEWLPRSHSRIRGRFGSSVEIPLWCISADGRRFAKAGRYGEKRQLIVSDVATGKTLLEINVRTTGLFHYVQFTPDGKHIAVVFAKFKTPNTIELDMPIYIRRWNIGTGKELPPIGKTEAHAKQAFRPLLFTFSPCGRFVVALGAEGDSKRVIRVWSVSGRGKSWRLAKQDSAALPIVFSPDGRRLAAVEENKIILWDSRTGKRVKKFSYDLEGCEGLWFSPDGNYLAAGNSPYLSFAGEPLGIRLWNSKTGQKIATLNGARALHFAPNSKTFAVLHDETIRLHDTATGKLLFSWKDTPGRGGRLRQLYHYQNQGAGGPVAFSPDGTMLITVGETGRIRRWHVKTGIEIPSPANNRGIIWQIRFSPNSKLIATGGSAGVSLWDVATHKHMHLLDRDSGKKNAETRDFLLRSALSLAFTPDNRYVAAGWGDGTITVWDTVTGKRRWRKKAHKTYVWSLTFANDNSRLITASGDGHILYWRTRDGALLREQQLPLKEIDSGGGEPGSIAVLTPDGRMAVTMDKSGSKLWELATATVRRKNVPIGLYVGFAPNSQRLAALMEAGITIMDLDKNHKHRTVKSEGDVTGVAFSPQGRHLITSDAVGNVSLWNPATATLLAKRQARTRITSTTISPNGKYIATAHDDATILLWDLPAALATRSAKLQKQQSLLWKQLSGKDARTAGQALAQLADDADCIAFVNDRLRKKPLRTYRKVHASRIVELLERVGTAAAIKLLETLSKEKSTVWQEEAQASLRRLSLRQQKLTPSPVQKNVGKKLPHGALQRYGARTFHHGSLVHALRLLPDGKTLLTITNISDQYTEAVHWWDLSNGQRKVHMQRPMTRRDSYIPDGCLSPNGRLLAIVHSWHQSEKSPANIRLIDVATNKIVRTIPDPRMSFMFGQFTPNGKQLIVSHANEGCLKVFDVATARLIGRFPLQEKKKFFANSFTIAPDGTYLVGLGIINETNHVVRVWNLRKRTLSATLTGTVRKYSPVAFSPDGNSFAAIIKSSRQKTPRLALFNPVGGKRLHDLGEHAQESGMLLFSPDGKYLLSTVENKVRVWDVAKKKELTSLPWKYGLAIAFSPNGRLLVLREWNHVAIWDVTNWQKRYYFPCPSGRDLYASASGRGERLEAEAGFGLPIAFSADSKTLFVAGQDAVRRWDMTTGKEIVVPGTQPLPTDLVCSPDEKTLAAISEETIFLWDIATGKRRNRLQARFETTFRLEAQAAAMFGKKTITETASPCCAVFSSSNKMVATGYTSGHIVLWDAIRGQRRQTLHGHKRTIISLSFSDDEKTLISTAKDFTQIRWNLTTGQQQSSTTLPGYTKPKKTTFSVSPAVQIAGQWYANRKRGLSPDQRLVVTVDKAVHLIERWSGQERFRVPAVQPRGPFAFSPDGRLLLCCETGFRNQGGDAIDTADTALLLIDVVHGRKLRSFGPHRKFADAAFSPDGSLLAVADKWGITLWRTATGDLIAQRKAHRGPCSAVTFSPDGRRLFSAGADRTIVVWDVAALTQQPSMAKVSSKEFISLWQKLAAPDAGVAYQTMLRLREHPQHTLALFRRHLKPAEVAKPKQVQQWIAQLDHKTFRIREQAMQKLTARGPVVIPALLRARAKNLTLEHRQRIDRLLDRLRKSKLTADQVRDLRAVEVVEWIGTTEARSLLRRLARRTPATLVTRDARAALRRVERGQSLH